jgi:short-subunit dehydrogenase
MRPAPRNLLITGASSGLGAALARHYAAPGTRIALTGRDAARLAAVAVSCRAAGATVETAALDVTDREALAQWIAGIDTAMPLDLVVANAGISGGTEDEAAARRIFAVNLDGVLNTVYPILPRMVSRKAGQIALMSSLAGFRGLPDAPAYCASKAAVKALAEAWRGSLWPSGVRVSVICPGFVTTAMTAGRQSPMPFLMSAERAAAIIARGLARDHPRIAFPWPMLLAVRLLATLPPRLADRAVRPRS